MGLFLILSEKTPLAILNQAAKKNNKISIFPLWIEL